MCAMSTVQLLHPSNMRLQGASAEYEYYSWVEPILANASGMQSGLEDIWITHIKPNKGSYKYGKIIEYTVNT